MSILLVGLLVSLLLNDSGMPSTIRSSNGITSRCVFCAFRAHQLALQIRRWRYASTKRLTQHGSSRSRRDHEETAAKHPWRFHDADAPRKAVWSFGNRGGITKFLTQGKSRGPASLLHRAQRRPGLDFDSTLSRQLRNAKEELQRAPILDQLAKEAEEGGGEPQVFERIWKEFTKPISRSREPEALPFGLDTTTNGTSVMQDFRTAFDRGGAQALRDRIRYAFYNHLTGARFNETDLQNQKEIADLKYPSEWYPATRVLQRTFHLHVGPTNSGKTYNALQRLEKAKNGVYAGPLRLLAHEVYSRMNAKGIPCALMTGEERRQSTIETEGGDSSIMFSCTVEMAPLNTSVDVAVIDEIQMIGNEDRGWAWTQAVLGIKAKEVHLCGEERSVPLIRELCASMGVPLEIHRYKRLSPLRVASSSLNGNLDMLRKGDCIVSFSVMGIHSLRRDIERRTGKKVATVYGSLPPETRAQQARLFNEQDNDYDFLVASDAVGMGLNLAIKRIIFESTAKYNGTRHLTLGIADIKQIAGRAGRYRTAAQAMQKSTKEETLSSAKGEESPEADSSQLHEPENVGFVTALEDIDHQVLSAAMNSEAPPLRTAGLFPPGTVLERFSNYFPPGTPFSYILTRLHELCSLNKRYHLCALKDHVWIADLIEPIQGLTVTDRNTLCAVPASRTDLDLWKNLLPAYARIIETQSGGNIAEIKELPLEVLEAPISSGREYLRRLEALHKGIVAYLWLSFRFAGVFSTRALAQHVKGLVEERIEQVLGQMSFTEVQRKRVAARREQELMREMAFAMEEEAKEKKNGKTVGDDIGDDDDATSVDVGAEDELDDVELGEDSEAVDGHRNAEDGIRRLLKLRDSQDYLREQTSLTSGGDRFGGEEDIVFEEPGEADLRIAPEGPDSTPRDGRLDADLIDQEEELPPQSGNFAAWRSQQLRGESQASHEDEDEPTSVDSKADAVDVEEPAAKDAPPETDTPAFSHSPRKHLAHVLVNATGVERNMTSRP